ncbi:MAG: sensor histidine kinase, partial [Myxococcaceae bacterium]
SRRAFERESLQRSWLQLVLEQIPDGIILLDERGRVSAINRAARALMCGPTGRKDAYGNEIMFDVRDKLGQPLRDEDMPMVRALREGVELKETELMLQVHDGRQVPVFVSAVPVRRPDGKIAGAVTVAQDITARKELDRLREEWSSLVAHDLRQPATVISFASQLLPRLHEGALNDGETRALERIQTASHRLKRMIEDLLDFSRIEAQRLSVDRQPVDLCTITRSIVERTHELTGVPIALGCDQEGFISGDPVRVEQVLGNLLSNAIKYGNPGAEIHVEVRNQPQMVLLSVKNHGPGISEDELPRLFSRFTRTASAASGQIEGLGLGLYISKGIVEAHGGRIWAESAPGHTTTFHVLWPSLKAASHAGPKDVDEPTHVH